MSRSKPTIDLPDLGPDLGPSEFDGQLQPVPPESTLIGEIQSSGRCLVLVPLETLEERWAGRPGHPFVVRVEGAADELAAMRPSLTRFVITDLPDGAWDVTGPANRVGGFEHDQQASQAAGAILEFATSRKFTSVKARTIAARRGGSIADRLVRAEKGVGVHNELKFDLGALRTPPGSKVMVYASPDGSELLLRVVTA